MGSWQIAYLEIGGSVQERMAVGLQVTAVGMTVCFIVLTLLYAIFLFLGKMGHAPNEGRGLRQRVAGSAAEPDLSGVTQPSTGAGLSKATATAVPVAPPTPDQQSELAVVAAMAAALAAATEDAGSLPAGATKRAPFARKSSSWALSGRVQLMEDRAVPARHRA